MSLATWMAEYYSVPALSATGSTLESALHSLRKWRGLRPEILARHGIKKRRCSLVESRNPYAGLFTVDSQTCALCRFYDEICEECPLWQEDVFGCSGSPGSAYSAWVMRDDPGPMITLLERVVGELKRRDPQPAAQLLDHGPDVYTCEDLAENAL